jgi:hypothetical protein
MRMFADIHKGSQMFTVNEDVSTYDTIEHFGNAASHRMTFHKCIVEMSKIFLNVANGNNDDPVCGIVTLQQSQMPMHVSNMSSIQRKMEDVLLARKETGWSPKKNVLKRLEAPMDADKLVASKQF